MQQRGQGEGVHRPHQAGPLSTPELSDVWLPVTHAAGSVLAVPDSAPFAVSSCEALNTSVLVLSLVDGDGTRGSEVGSAWDVTWARDGCRSLTAGRCVHRKPPNSRFCVSDGVREGVCGVLCPRISLSEEQRECVIEDVLYMGKQIKSDSLPCFQNTLMLR